MSTNTIEHTGQYAYERYEASRRFEEATDIAERLGFPIDTTIEYEMRSGSAYCRTDKSDRPFHNQTWLALQRGREVFDGDQAFEQERLRLEHEEALTVDALGRGELDGNILIKYSKVPDAIVEGKTSIKGYRRDLLRSFVRVYSLTDSGVKCRLFTLDGNNQQAVGAVGQLLGIDTTRPSEQVLADQCLMSVPVDTDGFVQELIDRAKLVFDDTHLSTTGERVQSGSKYVDRHDAMREIAQQPGLFEQHMAAISKILAQSRSAGDSESHLEEERKRTAAAIKLASAGATISSNTDVSVGAELVSGNYDRECATAPGMNQALAMENVWTYGECQVCFVKTKVGSCKVCAACARADDHGVDLLQLRQTNLQKQKTQHHLASAAISPRREIKRSPPVATSISERFGEYARVRSRIVTGDSLREVYDTRTGELIAAL